MIAFSALMSLNVIEQCIVCGDTRNIHQRGRQGVFCEAYTASEKLRDELVKKVRKLAPKPFHQEAIEVYEDHETGNWFVRIHACLEHAPVLRTIRMTISASLNQPAGSV